MIGRRHVARRRLPGFQTNKRNPQRQQVEADAGERLGQEDARRAQRPVQEQRTLVAVRLEDDLQKAERRAEDDGGQAVIVRGRRPGHGLHGLLDGEDEEDDQAGQ